MGPALLWWQPSVWITGAEAPCGFISRPPWSLPACFIVYVDWALSHIHFQSWCEEHHPTCALAQPHASGYFSPKQTLQGKEQLFRVSWRNRLRRSGLLCSYSEGQHQAWWESSGIMGVKWLVTLRLHTGNRELTGSGSRVQSLKAHLTQSCSFSEALPPSRNYQMPIRHGSLQKSTSQLNYTVACFLSKAFCISQALPSFTLSHSIYVCLDTTSFKVNFHENYIGVQNLKSLDSRESPNLEDDPKLVEGSLKNKNNIAFFQSLISREMTQPSLAQGTREESGEEETHTSHSGSQKQTPGWRV